MRVYLNGAVPVDIPLALIMRELSAAMPPLITSVGGNLPQQEKTLRLVLKNVVRMALGYFEGKLKGAPSSGIPAPVWDESMETEHADVLVYGVWYIIRISLSLLARVGFDIALAEAEEDGVQSLTVVGFSARRADMDADAGSVPRTLDGRDSA